MKQLILFFISISLLACFTSSKSVDSNNFQNSSTGKSAAEYLLDQSITFHDPDNNWPTFKSVLNFTVERPEKADSKRTIKIDNGTQHFSFEAPFDDGVLIYEVNGNQGTAKWNSSHEIPVDKAEKYRISAERAVMYRDYYTYLYGMPMKLKDPGPIIDPDVERIEHDEVKNDGEYILFEERIELGGVKIPRIRRWYYNVDEKYLASDVLER